MRELKHCLEFAMNMCDEGQILPSHLPPYLMNEEESDERGGSLQSRLSKYERELILDAMQQTKGNVLKAAKLLSIPRQTLQYKLKNIVLTNIRHWSQKDRVGFGGVFVSAQ